MEACEISAAHFLKKAVSCRLLIAKTLSGPNLIFMIADNFPAFKPPALGIVFNELAFFLLLLSEIFHLHILERKKTKVVQFVQETEHKIDE